MSIPQIGSHQPPKRKPGLASKIAGAVFGGLILLIIALALVAVAGWLVSVIVGVWS